MNNQPFKSALPLIFLRVGMICVFLYAGISGFISPEKYTKWIPSFLLSLGNFDTLLFLKVFFAFELFLVLLIIFRRWAAIGAFFMACTLALITVLNFSGIDVLFRNVGLFFAALALFMLERERRQKQNIPSQAKPTIDYR